MQLAHYRALLDAAGIGSPECFAAGVCGSEGVIVWHDLAEANLPAPEYVDGAPTGTMSALARYDLEFAHRLGILQRGRGAPGRRGRRAAGRTDCVRSVRHVSLAGVVR